MSRQKNTKTTAIYWLVDMRTGLPFYAGKTVQVPAKRLTAHKSMARRGELGLTYDRVRECGDLVRIQVLEIVPIEQDWIAREQRWISLTRSTFPNVTNVSDGGEGIPGNIHSTETRAKISLAHRGKKKSLEARARMSAAKRGRKQSPEAIEKTAASNRGRTHTPEARSNMSAAQRGRNFSQEHRVKIGAASRGRKRSAEAIEKSTAALRGRKCSDETRARMSAAHTGKKGPTPSPETRAKTSASITQWWARRRAEAVQNV